MEGRKDERETVELRAEDEGCGEPDGSERASAPPIEHHAASHPSDVSPATGERRADAARRYYAALDLGTNNCRLLVAQPTRRGFKVKTSFSRIIRLGEGLSKSGRLSNDAIERTLEALQICAGKMRSLSVARPWRGTHRIGAVRRDARSAARTRVRSRPAPHTPRPLRATRRFRARPCDPPPPFSGTHALALALRQSCRDVLAL